jgi:hypothetical protein
VDDRIAVGDSNYTGGEIDFALYVFYGSELTSIHSRPRRDLRENVRNQQSSIATGMLGPLETIYQHSTRNERGCRHEL